MILDERLQRYWPVCSGMKTSQKERSTIHEQEQQLSMTNMSMIGKRK